MVLSFNPKLQAMAGARVGDQFHCRPSPSASG